MSRPSTTPSWSTNANYPAGAKDWSSQTTKVQPSAGKLAQGLEPNTDQAAEEINWLYNLICLWIVWFDSLLFTMLSVTPPSTGANTPQLRFLDAAGNGRSLVDHNGYFLGRTSEFRMEWLQLADARINAGPAYALNNPTSTYPSPFASVAGGTGIATNYFIDGAQTLVHGGANFLSVVFEAEVAWSTITATNTTLGVGLSDSFSVAAPANAIIFQRVSGGANWQGLMTGSAAVPLGVAPVVDTVPSQRLRIEVHGSTSPYGSGANGRARFFVNEALVGEVTGVVPSAALIPVFCVTTGGSAPNVGTNPLVGPFRVIWNRLLSLPAL